MHHSYKTLQERVRHALDDPEEVLLGHAVLKFLELLLVSLVVQLSQLGGVLPAAFFDDLFLQLRDLQLLVDLLLVGLLCLRSTPSTIDATEWRCGYAFDSKAALKTLTCKGYIVARTMYKGKDVEGLRLR